MDVAIEPIVVKGHDLNQIIHHLITDSFLLIMEVLGLIDTFGLETMLMDDCVDDELISRLDLRCSTGADDQ